MKIKAFKKVMTGTNEILRNNKTFKLHRMDQKFEYEYSSDSTPSSSSMEPDQ